MSLSVIIYGFITSKLILWASHGQEDAGRVVACELVPTLARGTINSLIELLKGLIISSLILTVAAIFTINPIKLGY
ncbi:MAG: hypothetical protein QXU81_08050 [Candidatus Bathyarchaeia archaeon]